MIVTFHIFLSFRVNITYVDRDGERNDIKGKVGDNVMYLAHRHDLDIEGNYSKPKAGANGNTCREVPQP